MSNDKSKDNSAIDTILEIVRDRLSGQDLKIKEVSSIVSEAVRELKKWSEAATTELRDYCLKLQGLVDDLTERVHKLENKPDEPDDGDSWKQQGQ